MNKPVTITENQDVDIHPRDRMGGLAAILPKELDGEKRSIILGMTCGAEGCNIIHQHIYVSIDEAKSFRAMLDEVICRAETGAGRQ